MNWHGHPSASDGSNDPQVDLAARWLARLDRGLTETEQRDLDAWLASDPRNESELRRLKLEWRGFERARHVPELAALARQVEKTSVHRRHKAVGTSLWYGAAAACILALAGTFWWSGQRLRAPHAEIASYQVLASDTRRTVFSDGSVAELRGTGVVEAGFTATERRVRLVEGEVHFQVAHDAKRPFIVEVGDVSIRAIGTAFNVRLGREIIQILVTEGTVQMEHDRGGPANSEKRSARVTAGHRALVARKVVPEVQVRPVIEQEILEELAWQGPKLVFDRTPLADAVNAFNRYAAGGVRLKLLPHDSALRNRRIGGTFFAANAEGFARLMEQTGEVSVQRENGEVLLLAPP